MLDDLAGSCALILIAAHLQCLNWVQQILQEMLVEKFRSNNLFNKTIGRDNFS